VRFHPGLGEHARALWDLAMGHVVKVVICVAEPVWRAYAPRELSFVHAGAGSAFPTFWLRSHGGEHQLTAWAGGRHAMKLAGTPEHELVQHALAGFAATIGMRQHELASAMLHYHFHDYDADPFSRGAYSYTRVGGSTAAERLARPLGDRLFFAGEATDAQYEGTVGGALISGERAARQVLARIRDEVTASSSAAPSGPSA
jgi:monoamine oxidase